MEYITHCSRCVLPGTFPGISFDEHGVCNYCCRTPLPDEKQKAEVLSQFEETISRVRGRSGHDVILAYSGGKDSTYTLYLLTRVYGLKVLAWSFDNGFMSPQARANIVHMADELGATGVFYRPPFPVLRDTFRRVAENNIYSPKTLDRASSICTTCIGIVKALVLKTALSLRIPLVAYGWSPGQAPISSAIMQNGPRLQRITHLTVRDPLLAGCGAGLDNYFLDDRDLDLPADQWPINVHPLAFIDYDEERIISDITALGWVKPADTDPNSSNCTLNALANYLHQRQYHFHPYAWEIAGIVRGGYMSRNEGLMKTAPEENMDLVRFAARRLGIEVPE